MHGALSRGSVRSHDWSDLIHVFGAMQCWVRVSSREHKLHSVCMPCWVVQHWRYQCLYSLPNRDLWSHHCLDQCSVHGPVSGRHVWQLKWADYPGMFWELHCGVLLSPRVHVPHSITVRCWQLQLGTCCILQSLPTGYVWGHHWAVVRHVLWSL